MKKRIVCVVLAVIFCLSVLTPATFAQGETQVFNSAERLKVSNPLKKKCISTLGISSSEFDSMVDGLYEAVKNFEEYYELTEYGIYADEDNLYCIGEIVGEFSELFYVTGNFNFVAYEDDGTLFAVIFDYSYSRESAENMKKEIEKNVDYFVGDLINSELPDHEKILLIHDRMITYCEYDAVNVLNNPDNIPIDNFSLYGFMVKRIAVCEGYARTFSFLLSYLGIRAYNCLSYDMNHMWSIVIVDGTEYHTDVTFDDPIYDVAGKVSHSFLLVSTKKMKTLREVNDFYTSPVSEKYDNYPWTSSNTEACFINGSIYYFDNNNNKIMKLNGSSSVSVYQPADAQWGSDSGTWNGNHSRMATDGYYIYYSTTQDIIRLDLKTSKATSVYRPTVSGVKDFLIFGFTVDGDYFVIDMFNSPNFKENTKKLYEQRYKFATERRAGDLNGDGKTNVSDASIIRMIIVGKNTDEKLRKYADLNNDDKVNISDILILKKIITGKIKM